MMSKPGLLHCWNGNCTNNHTHTKKNIDIVAGVTHIECVWLMSKMWKFNEMQEERDVYRQRIMFQED